MENVLISQVEIGSKKHEKYFHPGFLCQCLISTSSLGLSQVPHSFNMNIDLAGCNGSCLLLKHTKNAHMPIGSGPFKKTAVYTLFI